MQKEIVLSQNQHLTVTTAEGKKVVLTAGVITRNGVHLVCNADADISVAGSNEKRVWATPPDSVMKEQQDLERDINRNHIAHCIEQIKDENVDTMKRLNTLRDSVFTSTKLRAIMSQELDMILEGIVEYVDRTNRK